MSKKDPHRRELLRAAAERERQQFLTTLPLPQADLRALFDYLDRPEASSCDHTFRQTEAFLQERGLTAERVLPWLRQHGGGCDCEVLATVEEAFTEAARERPGA